MEWDHFIGHPTRFRPQALSGGAAEEKTKTRSKVANEHTDLGVLMQLLLTWISIVDIDPTAHLN